MKRHIKTTQKKHFPEPKNLKDVVNLSKELLKININHPDIIHTLIKRIETFLIRHIELRIECEFWTLKEVTLNDEKEKVRNIKNNLYIFLYKDPDAFMIQLPSFAPQWSLSMLLWMNIGRCSILGSHLYRLHESFKIQNLTRTTTAPLKKYSGIDVFNELSVIKSITSVHKTRESLKVPGVSPFTSEYFWSPSDSDYLCACGIVTTNAPVLSLSLTALCDQIAALHSGWIDRLKYHADVVKILNLLEMRAWMFTAFSWSSDILDIPPSTLGHNLVVGGQGSDRINVMSLTRKIGGLDNKVIVSHRFIYEMQLFFITAYRHIKTHELHEIVPVDNFDIPGWIPSSDDSEETTYRKYHTYQICENMYEMSDKRDEQLSFLHLTNQNDNVEDMDSFDLERIKQRGECWKRFMNEMKACKRTVESDSGRVSTARLMRNLRTKPCERELYMKATESLVWEVNQIWYEFRSGESVKTIDLLFSPSSIRTTLMAHVLVPNPKYAKWKTLELRQTSHTPENTNEPRVKLLHCLARNVYDCKLASSMITSYLAGEDHRDFNWQNYFFIILLDLAKDVTKLETSGNYLPKVIQLMNDFYVYVRLKVPAQEINQNHEESTHKVFYIHTVDMETSVYVWLYIIYANHNSMLFDRYDLSKLTKHIFENTESRHFASRPSYEGNVVINDENKNDDDDDTLYTSKKIKRSICVPTS